MLVIGSLEEKLKPVSGWEETVLNLAEINNLPPLTDDDIDHNNPDYLDAVLSKMAERITRSQAEITWNKALHQAEQETARKMIEELESFPDVKNSPGLQYLKSKYGVSK